MANYLENLRDSLNIEFYEKHTLFGVINGYEVSIYGSQLSTEGLIAYINFYGNRDLKKEVVNEYLSFEGKSFAKGYITDYGVKLTLNGWTYGIAAKKLIKKLNHIISFLNERNVPGAIYSPLTGKELNEKTVVGINDGYVSLEVELANQIKEEFARQKEEYAAAPNNYLKGFVGSLIGSLIGAVAFIILYFIGFISAWVGVLSVFLAGILYKKFGGKETIVTYIGSGVISLAVIMITCVVFLRVDISLILQNEGINMTVDQAIAAFDEISEIYYRNIALTAFYTLLGIIAQVFYAFRKLKQKNNSVR